jgi:peptide deformylase
MGVEQILKLGDERLYEKSTLLLEKDLPLIKQTVKNLHDAMMDFRRIYKVGRAIAAPQIGIFRRLIYMNVDHPVVIINPTINPVSNEMITVWDDCMCFPNLLVKVERCKQIELKYLDVGFNEKHMILKDDLSELIQHEYDHLDGILATQRAIDDKSFRLRK